MLLSRSAKYGLQSVLYLAIKQQEEQRFRVTTIASDLDIPEHFLGKILQKLVKKDILNSAKGPNGGFFLKESSLDLPVISIIEAIDGLDAFYNCGIGINQCDEEHPCPIHKDYKPLREGFKQILSSKTIRDYKIDINEGKSFLFKL